MFTRDSRYQGVPDAVHDDLTGRPIRYKLLRIIPNPPAGDLHAVTQGDRLDRVAADAFGDPGAVVADLRRERAPSIPDELVSETGRRLVIPQSVG